MSEVNNVPKQKQDRRSFLLNLLLLGTAVTGVILSIPVLGAILAPVLGKTPQKWRPVGNVNDFTIGDTVLVKFANAEQHSWDGVSSRSSAWLRRVDENNFIAFAINCAHLGCPVRWVATAELFLCPCHGGVYTKDGTNAAGPPPHPLDRYQVRVNKNQVEILAGPIPITTG